MNPIEFLVAQGFRITSDPTQYRYSYPSGKRAPWGLRNYTEDGHNYDSFCGGYHRAYDFGKYDGAPIPSIADGEVVAGTAAYGNFGGTVVVAYYDLDIQVIYGHLKRNLPVKIGQKVKQGQTIGYQGNTNNQNAYMASHLHIQFQNLEYLSSEKAFVCTGIDPLKIDINKATKQPAKTKVKTYTAVKGDTLWGISQKYNTTVDKLKEINNLEDDVIGVGQVLKVSGSALPKVTEKPKEVVKPKTFSPNVNRGRTESGAYVKGKIDNLGAEVRKRHGSQKSGFNWNTQAGYSLKSGDVVFIYEVHNGWGRIYTGKQTGKGSNDWIWLGRMDVLEVFK